MKYGIFSLAIGALLVVMYGLFISESDPEAMAITGESSRSNISIETSYVTSGTEVSGVDVAEPGGQADPAREGFVDYQNDIYNFSFSYPTSAQLTEFTDEMLVIQGANAGGLVDVEVVTNEFQDVESVAALVYIEARLRCDASSLEGVSSVQCGEVVEREEYVSEAGVSGEKFFLEKIDTTVDGEEQVSVYGPIYAFPIAVGDGSDRFGALVIAPPVGAQTENSTLLNGVVESLQY